MKINFLTIFIFLLFNLTLKGQGSSIMVINLSGHIEYQKDQSSANERLLPGQKIAPTGTINLKNGATITLLQNGKPTQLSEAGVYDLKTLTKSNENVLNMSFAGRFWNFVNDGLSQSDDKESLNEYSDRVLAVHGGVQGFAMAESPLQTIMPAKGKIGTDLVTFSWHPLENTADYHVNIFHSETDELIFKAIIRDTSITLDFSQLVFHPEVTYEWYIETEDGEKSVIKSKIKKFEYFQNADEIIVKKANEITDYKEADTFEKKWMEAIVMEQENFIYDAFARYTDLRSQDPDNLLIRKLFATFLVRQDLTQEALKQMN